MGANKRPGIRRTRSPPGQITTRCVVFRLPRSLSAHCLEQLSVSLAELIRIPLQQRINGNVETELFHEILICNTFRAIVADACPDNLVQS
jgi:hypothetical protein